MTKVFEISVPAQKKLGGIHPVCNKATIHGNEPRVKFFPFTINPNGLCGTPQVSVFLRDLFVGNTENLATVAKTTIVIKIFLIIFR